MLPLVSDVSEGLSRSTNPPFASLNAVSLTIDVSDFSREPKSPTLHCCETSASGSGNLDTLALMSRRPSRSAILVALVVAAAGVTWLLLRAHDSGGVPALRGPGQLVRVQSDVIRGHDSSGGLGNLGAESCSSREPVVVARNVVGDSNEANAADIEASAAAKEPADTRVHPIYSFWDESGGPPMLDDELTLTLVEAADGVARERWSVSVELSAIREMQPRYSVAMPLFTSGRYRATCRNGSYKPADVCIPEVKEPRLMIVLERAE